MAKKSPTDDVDESRPHVSHREGSAAGVPAGRSDHWLAQQGRLTEPMVERAGSRHDEPVSYDEAFRVIGERLGIGKPSTSAEP